MLIAPVSTKNNWCPHCLQTDAVKKSGTNWELSDLVIVNPEIPHLDMVGTAKIFIDRSLDFYCNLSQFFPTYRASKPRSGIEIDGTKFVQDSLEFGLNCAEILKIRD